MVAALQKELFATIAEGLLYLPFVGLDAGDIALGMPGHTEEVAELAVGNAHVGGVHIAVYDPGHFAIVALGLAQLIAYEHEVGKRSVFKEELPFFGR